MSILGKSGACFSPKQGMLGSNLLWPANKTKLSKTKLKTKEQDAPSKAHDMWSNKNDEKDELIIADEEGDARGHPQA